MRRMGLEAFYRKLRTSIPAPLSATYPYRFYLSGWWSDIAIYCGGSGHV